ncbi:MAG: tRNA uridine(34) 5-carboxymethylaminomethyl modification radical SAM/GNAT enzyme Elp3 [Promethearchaeota archaeon]
MTSLSQELLHKALNDITISLINEPTLTRTKLEKYKRTFAKKYGLKRFVKNSEILNHVLNVDFLTEDEIEYLTHFLQVRRVRTISGIAVVAVMTKSSICPGNCIYCPEVNGVPKSYTGKEPAAMRGAQNNFIPKKQVVARLNQLKSIGHPLDKVHLIIMGGTFLATPLDYQEYFVKECLDGITGKSSTTLEEAHQNADTAAYRNVGITLETRPDYCKESHVNRILELGGTWVEIGIQVLSDKTLELIQRHHNLDDVWKAIRYAKDGGLKVTVHMMPNLFQSPEEDIKMFEVLYSDPKYVPDAVKIYPTLVLPNTKLFELWKKEVYKPYDSQRVIDVVASIKAITPPYVRIQRVQRDIPAYLILDGVQSGNLRELAREELTRRGSKCSCIRCREVGHQTNLGNKSWINKEKKFSILEYPASNGIEYFISFETDDNETLFGFLRLREPSSASFRPELNSTPSTIIRELHVYGKLVGIGKLPKNLEWQHRGIGQKMIALAEETSKAKGYKKMLVTSGLGVRDYYRKLGFHQEGPFMAKSLK